MGARVSVWVGRGAEDDERPGGDEE